MPCTTHRVVNVPGSRWSYVQVRRYVSRTIADGRVVCSTGTWIDGFTVTRQADGRGHAQVSFPRLPLLKGRYSVAAFLMCERALHVYEAVEHFASVQVSDSSTLTITKDVGDTLSVAAMTMRSMFRNSAAVMFSPPCAFRWRMVNDSSGVGMYRLLSGGRIAAWMPLAAYTPAASSEPLRRRCWEPPWMSGTIDQARATASAPTPTGPPALCADTLRAASPLLALQGSVSRPDSGQRAGQDEAERHSWGHSSDEARPEPGHGRPWSLVLSLPPLATVVLKPRR